MSDKKLAILGVVAVVMAALAFVQSRMANRPQTFEGTVLSPLVAGLNVDTVAGLEIVSGKGQHKTRLVMNNGTFVVPEKDNYPADVSKINPVISGILDIRTNELITTDKVNHAQLGVTEETARYVVRFLNDKQESIVGAVISESKGDGGMQMMQRGDQTAYARLESADETYTISSAPYLSTAAMDFIDKTIVQVPQSDIVKVEVAGARFAYTLAAKDGGDIQLADMPEGKQYKETGYQGVFRALSSFQFDDVKAKENMPEDLTFDISYVCTLKNDKVYRLMIGQKDEHTWCTVSAQFVGKQQVMKANKVESEEELKAKEAILLAQQDVKKFNEAHTNWVYQIPSYKAGDLTKTLDDLIEDIPAESPEEEKPEPAM